MRLAGHRGHEDARRTTRSRSDEARFQGDGVAVVIADTRALAQAMRPSSSRSTTSRSPAVGRRRGGARGRRAARARRARHERVLRLEARDRRRSMRARRGADVVVTRRYYPAAPDPERDRAARRPRAGRTPTATSRCGRRPRSRTSSASRSRLVLGIPETKLRVIAPDVGGGFGSKLDVYAEELLAVALARRLGRPVKWTEERSENYVATIHGRDFVTSSSSAPRRTGRSPRSGPT